MAELLIQWERDVEMLKHRPGSIRDQKIREYIDTMSQIAEDLAAVKIRAKSGEQLMSGVISVNSARISTIAKPK